MVTLTGDQEIGSYLGDSCIIWESWHVYGFMVKSPESHLTQSYVA